MVDTAINTDFNTYWKRTSCYAAANLDRELRCDFLNSITHCMETFHYREYIQLFDCYLKLTNRQLEFLVGGLLIMMSAYLLLVIGVISDKFFAPALKKFSVQLKMNQHLAGITILSICNSELYLNLESMDYPGPIFTNCLGTCLFMMTISVGLVGYTSSFQLCGHTIVRDILFVLLAAFLVDYIIENDGQISRLESLSLIVLYVVYIVINIIELILLKKEYADIKKDHANKIRKKRVSSIERLQLKEKKDIASMDYIFSRRESNRFSRSVKIAGSLNKKKRVKSTSFVTYIQRKPDAVDEEATKMAVHSDLNSKNAYLFEEFLDSLTPFTCDTWNEGSRWMKFWLIICTPPQFFSCIFIPVVDVEMDKHGWSKLLNCIQLLVFPLLFFLKPFGREYALYVLALLLITAPLAIVVFITTRTDYPPRYHWLFSFLACFNSIFIMFVVSSWFAILLDIVGNSFLLSHEFIGITFSTWGASSGSVLTNVIVALHGYEKMAFAASFGAPLLNLLLSMGIIHYNFSLRSEDGSTEIYEGTYEVCAFVFLMFALGMTLIWITVLNFQTRRSISIFNIMLYLIFLMFATLSEREIIHQFTRARQFKIK